MKAVGIGADLAKSIFQVHGSVMAIGEIRFRKKLTREQFHMFMSKFAPGVVILEARGRANDRAGQTGAMGPRLCGNSCATDILRS